MLKQMMMKKMMDPDKPQPDLYKIPFASHVLKRARDSMKLGDITIGQLKALAGKYPRDITPKENLKLFFEHKAPQWVPMALLDSNLMLPFVLRERPPMNSGGYDWFGVHWTYEPTTNAPMVTPGQPPVLTDITKWKTQVAFPDVSAINWEHDARNTELLVDHRLLRSCVLFNGCFERMHSLMGFANALCALVDEPEACYDFFGAIADHKIKIIEKLHRYYKVDNIYYHDDWGTQQNMFFSADLWRAIAKPHLKRIIDACKERGLYASVHSCGHMDKVVPDMVELGVDCWDSAQTMNDLAGIKKRFGDKLCLSGATDNAIIGDGSLGDEEIRAYVRKQIDDLGKGGGYMPWSVALHSRGLLLLMKETLEYGSTFYRKEENRMLRVSGDSIV